MRLRPCHQLKVNLYRDQGTVQGAVCDILTHGSLYLLCVSSHDWSMCCDWEKDQTSWYPSSPREESVHCGACEGHWGGYWPRCDDHSSQAQHTSPIGDPALLVMWLDFFCFCFASLILYCYFFCHLQDTDCKIYLGHKVQISRICFAVHFSVGNYLSTFICKIWHGILFYRRSNVHNALWGFCGPNRQFCVQKSCHCCDSFCPADGNCCNNDHSLLLTTRITQAKERLHCIDLCSLTNLALWLLSWLQWQHPIFCAGYQQTQYFWFPCFFLTIPLKWWYEQWWPLLQSMMFST